MTIVLFLLALTAAGLGGYAILVYIGLDELESWTGGRLAGLVVVAMPAWWAGVLGLHQWRMVGAVVIVACAVGGGVVAWRRKAWRQLLIAEGIFWAFTAIVLLIRLDHPEIMLTEKPMDLGIFATLLRADGFPPPDMWLAGGTLPYYYWGALLWSLPLSLSSLPLEIGYNLIVGLIGGTVASLLWMLGRRVGGGHGSGFLVAFFGLLAGTPDGLRQIFAGAPFHSLDYWHASRQIPDTITEFPLFTVWLGDLHPHLLSMPIVCLAVLVAWHAGRAVPKREHIAALAVLFGVAWAANPWTMPPTLTAIALLLVAGPDRWHWPSGSGRVRWLGAVGVAVGGWLVTAPFHLGFRPFFQGVRPVFAWTEVANLLLYAGCLLLPASLAAAGFVRRLVGGDEERKRAIVLAAAAATLTLAAATGRPTLVLLAAILAVFVTALFSPLAGAARPAFALAALGTFLFLVPEVVYVVDSYGEDLHRMNTVFKSYIQGWIFFAVALPVLLQWGVRGRPARITLVVVMAVASGPHLVSMVAQQFTASERGFNGMRWMTEGDRAIVRYLRSQAPGTVIAEAVGGAYTQYARLSAASGVPAYLGWANHESVWRGNQILSETYRRALLIARIFTAPDGAGVRRAAADAGVHLVAIGSLERKDYTEEELRMVAEAGEVVLDQEGGTVVRFGFPEPGGQFAMQSSIAAAIEDDGAAVGKTSVRLGRDHRGFVRDAVAVGAQINDGELAQLRGMPGLESLDIGECPITDAGLTSLAGLTELQILYLHDVPITDDGLVHLRGLTRLTVLSLKNTEITGEGLIYLKGLTDLEVLNLSDTAITDDALTNIEGLAELNTLGLEGTKITNAGLIHCKPLKKLRVLNLNRCAITDDGLANLLGLTNLRMLYAAETKLTEDNVEKFRMKMTSLAVQR